MSIKLEDPTMAVAASMVKSSVHQPEKSAFINVIADGVSGSLSRITSPNDAPSEEFLENTNHSTYTIQELSSHNASDDLWIAIDNGIYDVTRFQHDHPGGHKIMAGVAGKDATKKFDKYHRRAILEKYKKELKIGTLRVDQSAQGAKKRLFGILGSRKK